jgi:hypothetical protein
LGFHSQEQLAGFFNFFGPPDPVVVFAVTSRLWNLAGREFAQ